MNLATEKYVRRNWLWLLVNLAIVGVGIRTIFMLNDLPSGSGWVLMAGNAKPASEVVQFSGMVALILLVLSLACTPLSRIFRLRKAVTVRKSLGLWGFAFVCLHMCFYIGNTELFSSVEPWQRIGRSLVVGWQPYHWGKAPFAREGYFALLLLIPLAITSNRRSMKWLGKWWKRLHSLVYLAVPLAILHYGWKENMGEPWGFWGGSRATDDRAKVIIFAVVVGLLLLMRIPIVRRWLTGLGANNQTRQNKSPTALS